MWFKPSWNILCEEKFLKSFNRPSFGDPSRYLKPPFVNSFHSLVLDPSLSDITEGKKSQYKKIDVCNTSRLNKLYFAIKVFNYLYASIKNISLEEAESPKATLLLNYILKYFINNKVSTQTHILHGVGQIWYKDIIPDKKLYFDIDECYIIGATVFIASMIDTVFDHPSEHEDTSQIKRVENLRTSPQKPDSAKKRHSIDSKPDISPRKSKRIDTCIKRIKHQLHTLATSFSAMNDLLNFSVMDICFNLSKCFLFC